jgi:probable rRNA maturation factor
MDAPETAEPPSRQRSGGDEPEDPSGRPRRKSLEIDLLDATGRLDPADLLWLRARAADAARRLLCSGVARIRIVADQEMAAAHRRLLAVPGTTDVITSNLGEPDQLDADLLLCLDEAVRQGAARRHAAREELLLYIIHGLLHCQGHDDHDPAEAAAMHALEDQTLAAIGVGARFARDPGAGGAP